MIEQRRTRWPLLAVLVLLGLLLALTTSLERSAPLAPLADRAMPEIEALPGPLLEEPLRCSRNVGRADIEDLRAQLQPEGRLTSDIVHACPRMLDGRDVTYIGEVVGDVLRRPGGAWVLVNDDAYALEVGPLGPHREQRGFNTGLAVWLPDGQHEQLGAPGRHGRRGDVVRIEGVLLRADPADGGGITIRSARIEVLAPSAPVVEPLNVPLVIAAVAAALAALGAWVWDRRRSRGRARTL
jgi:hypothetical protein